MAEETHPLKESAKPKKSSPRTWIIFFLVLGLFGWWIAPGMMTSYKMYMNKAHDSFAKAELSNLHTSCLAYWAKNGLEKECSVSVANQYGFQPNPKISIHGSGTQTTFTATAQHQDSATVLRMDAKRNIN